MKQYFSLMNFITRINDIYKNLLFNNESIYSELITRDGILFKPLLFVLIRTFLS